MNKESIKHGLPPLVGESPKVLILGSMPGDESLKQGRYYSNSRNKFWEIINAVFPRKTNDEKEMTNEDYLISKGIALWDCLEYCDRDGSLDMNIDFKSVVPNDLGAFLKKYATITHIVINGKGVYDDYYKPNFGNIDRKIIVLNSTSGANAIPLKDKIEEWSIVKAWCEDKEIE